MSEATMPTGPKRERCLGGDCAVPNVVAGTHQEQTSRPDLPRSAKSRCRPAASAGLCVQTSCSQKALVDSRRTAEREFRVPAAAQSNARVRRTKPSRACNKLHHACHHGLLAAAADWTRYWIRNSVGGTAFYTSEPLIKDLNKFEPVFIWQCCV